MLRFLGPLLSVLLFAASLPTALPAPLPPSGAPPLSPLTLSLSESTFASELALRGRLFVKFFAPWCSHCRSLAPTWDRVAASIHALPHPFPAALSAARSATAFKQPGAVVAGSYRTPTTIAEVDCTVNTALCRAFQVTGYPTLALVQAAGVGETVYFHAPLVSPFKDDSAASLAGAAGSASGAAGSAGGARRASGANASEEGLVLSYSPLPTPTLAPASPTGTRSAADAAAADAPAAAELAAAATVASSLPGGVARYSGGRDFKSLVAAAAALVPKAPLPSKYKSLPSPSALTATTAPASAAAAAGSSRGSPGSGSDAFSWISWRFGLVAVAVLAFAGGFILNATVCRVELSENRRARAILAKNSRKPTLSSSFSSGGGGGGAAAATAEEEEDEEDEERLCGWSSGWGTEATGEEDAQPLHKGRGKGKGKGKSKGTRGESRKTSAVAAAVQAAAAAAAAATAAATAAAAAASDDDDEEEDEEAGVGIDDEGTEMVPIRSA